MKNLRAYAIMDYLKEKKYGSVEELIRRFGVSPATIYRDLADLEARGAVRKVHGGVAFKGLPSARNYPNSSPFQERISRNRKAKEEISLQAFRRVEEGDILFLDSSTTAYYFSQLLETSSFSNLTVVTNSVTVIQNFHKYPSHYVRIGLGGSYNMQMNSFLGQMTLSELEYLTISKAFVSAFGVEEDKVTTNHEYHGILLMKVLNLAERKYLLADRSKFNRSGLFRIAPPQVFDEILSA